VSEVVCGALGVVQDWLSDERFRESRLYVVTRGSVAARDGDDVSDLAGASVWGLVRAAQLEHPGAISMIDIDGHDDSWRAFDRAIAADEPQVAVRVGEILTPKLVRATGSTAGAAEPEGSAPLPDGSAPAPDGRTVLITGGTGVLGGLLARHLVAERGVRSVMLASRRGSEAPGAPELQADLEALGARVTIVACDVSSRDGVRELLEQVPDELPLGTVIHAAAALDDGVIASLTAERMQRVLAPKLDAAWHLHELTRDMDLQGFVLFSSAAGLLGSPGQGNYAAANAFLDALAAHRRAQGLPGLSMAWGLWEPASGLTGDIDEIAMSRMRRSGIRALSADQGLRLYDAALALGGPLFLLAGIDVAGIRKQARAGLLPVLLRGLVRDVAPRTASAGSLARRLADVTEAEREELVVEIVRAETAAVLGHASSTAIDPQRTFQDLGFDSLTAVELRNSLNAVTGLRLAATLVFDYPRPVQVAGHILEQIGRGGSKPEALVDADIDTLAARLVTIAEDERERGRIASRLQALVDEFRGMSSAEDGALVAQRIQSASAEEVLDFIDRELSSTEIGPAHHA
jgi:NADP-dependent 3-hydroxy acid dehydrogenase YdfG/acyl carrier protein